MSLLGTVEAVVIESALGIARQKIASAIEMYTPYNAARPAAVAALHAVLVEFEAAVREHERTLVGVTPPAVDSPAHLERDDLPASLPANPLAHEGGTPSAEELAAQSGVGVQVMGADGQPLAPSLPLKGADIYAAAAANIAAAVAESTPAEAVNAGADEAAAKKTSKKK